MIFSQRYYYKHNNTITIIMKHITILLKWLIILWAITIVGTLFWDYIFIFDLFSHFYLQFFVLGFCLFVGALFLMQKRYAILSAVLLVFLWWSLFPVVFQDDDLVERVDIYYINSNYYINNANQVIDDIEKYDPKYVAVVELRPNLEKALTEKYWKENSITHQDGVLSYWLFSREKIFSSTKHYGNMYPFLEFTIPEGNFYLIHPLPPTSLFGAWFQQENFWEIRALFDVNENENKYILWDFNSSHYSRVFQKYFWDLNYDVLYSWKRWHPLSIPIDYVLWNNDNFKVEFWDLRASDHSPLLIQFD